MSNGVPMDDDAREDDARARADQRLDEDASEERDRLRHEAVMREWDADAARLGAPQMGWEW